METAGSLRITGGASIRRRAPALIAALLTLIGAARIITTYHVFNHTTDEPAHLACGLELLQKGTYFSEPKHPPLARWAVGIGPYLAGARLPPPGDSIFADGLAVLYEGDRYWDYLSLARLGVLPFFFLTAAVTWFWARRYGDWAGVTAVFLLTASPTVLAHSGLATTDAAAASTLLLALYMLCRWTTQPSRRTSIALGLATGLAVMAKFSAIPYLLACAGSLGVAFSVTRLGREKLRAVSRRITAKDAAAAAACFLAVVWLVYGCNHSFDRRPITVWPAALQTLLTSGDWVDLDAEGRVDLPMPHSVSYLTRGLASVVRHAERGHPSFFFGETSNTGHVLYFPAALALKSTIPLLLLVAIGFGLMLRGRAADQVAAAPAWFAGAILLVAMTSSINIGVRHVLAVYPLMAIAGAYCCAQFLSKSGPVIPRAVIAVLLCWHAGAGVAAHPDYIPYFNPAAGLHPEEILVDSNLDWGQDLNRVGAELRRRDIKQYSYAKMVIGDPLRHGFPEGGRPLDLSAPVQGWVVMSATWRALYRKAMPWLEDARLVDRIGRTFFLYYVEPESESPGS